MGGPRAPRRSRGAARGLRAGVGSCRATSIGGRSYALVYSHTDAERAMRRARFGHPSRLIAAPPTEQCRAYPSTPKSSSVPGIRTRYMYLVPCAAAAVFGAFRSVCAQLFTWKCRAAVAGGGADALDGRPGVPGLAGPPDYMTPCNGQARLTWLVGANGRITSGDDQWSRTGRRVDRPAGMSRVDKRLHRPRCEWHVGT